LPKTRYTKPISPAASIAQNNILRGVKLLLKIRSKQVMIKNPLKTKPILIIKKTQAKPESTVNRPGFSGGSFI